MCILILAYGEVVKLIDKKTCILLDTSAILLMCPYILYLHNVISQEEFSSVCNTVKLQLVASLELDYLAFEVQFWSGII